MEKEKWIKELSALLAERAQCSEELAYETAQGQYEGFEDDVRIDGYTPEEAYSDIIQEWAASA